jgi:hypothetical protein
MEVSTPGERAPSTTMKMYCGSGGIPPRILNLGTTWRWVFSFTSPSLYPRRLGGPQSQYGRGGEKNKSYHCPCWEMNPGRPTRSLVCILTELHRLFDEVVVGLICSLDERNKKCLQRFGGETPCKVAIWRTEKDTDIGSAHQTRGSTGYPENVTCWSPTEHGH